MPEQRAIAHILGTLDDKIELNRRINQTLEEMARALFKSWFVDFDPVRAKAALRKHAVRASEPEYARLHPHPSPPPSRGRGSENSGRGSDNSPLEGESARRGALAPLSRWGEAQRTDSTWKDIQRSYSKQTLEQAKALRQRQTDAEGLLWHYLRKKQLGGFKFRRQQPIGPYIVDFACMPEMLLVELDGGQHAERAAHDQRRDAFLRSKGFRVLRFWNNEAFENCFGVLERVYEALPNPPPRQPEPAGSTAATPPQGGSDGTPSTVTGSPPSPLDSTPSSFSSSPSLLEGEGWGGGPPTKQEDGGTPTKQEDGGAPMKSEGEGVPAPTTEWTVERARAYLAAMDPQIVDLFPDRLVDSELGEIPEGWEIGKLNDIVIRHRENEHPSESPDTVFSHFSIPAYDEGQAPKQELGKEIKSGKSQVPPGVVLVSKLNPEIERVWLVNVTADDNAICSTEFLVLEARRPFTQSYVYCLARSPLFRQQINTLVTGTSKSHQRAPANAVLSLDTVVPNISLVEAFDMSASEFLSRTLRCRSEARDLAEQRDTLLSKLLTGALPVREIVS